MERLTICNLKFNCRQCLTVSTVFLLNIFQDDLIKKVSRDELEIMLE